MPAQANANVIALQLEKVRGKVPLLYERDDILLTMIQQRGDVEKISSRNMRLPLQVNPGGKAGSYNADGGERAVENAAKREVANGMKQFRAFLDKLMQTAGNGVLGTINSIASTTFTMAVPSGAALVYVGQTIQIYDTTLTSNRGPSNVRLAINKVRKSLGINHVAKLIAYMAVEQEHAWENLGITVSQIIKEGGNGDGNDLDLLYGGLAASYIFYFDTAFQVWDDSPRTGAFIDTLARPSGY